MRKLMFGVALVAASAALPASAQIAAQPGLVNVNIQNVTILEDFLNDAQIAALNNLTAPVTVQAPIGVAATVCGVSAAVLGKSTTSPVACNAKSGSRALAQLVEKQKLSQTR